MKKILLATTLILATSLSSVLMAGPDSGNRHERGLERMTKELALTAEQQEQFRQIHEEQGAKLQSLREEGKNRMDAVLTDEQRVKAESLREERRERMEERRAHRDGRGERPCDKK